MVVEVVIVPVVIVPVVVVAVVIVAVVVVAVKHLKFDFLPLFLFFPHPSFLPHS